HRERMAREIRSHMPVLGINLRVAPEWGVICGYKKGGADLYCRTKYDGDVLGKPGYEKGKDNPHDYLPVDNWPFLIAYFAGEVEVPSDRESLLGSLRILVDCSGAETNRGYRQGFTAYETWRGDLLDDGWYEGSDDDQLARRFSVNQFCALALYDARKAAHAYLSESARLLPEKADGMNRIVLFFKEISEKARRIHAMLDSGEYLVGERARRFWTRDMRIAQAGLLAGMLETEREAVATAKNVLMGS
ncbi:MAG: hypothetical protein FWE70_08260, partial [Oscillospiraceae bacterium]|nr:hypothetical protein [Oscillospiraceae bacterium]